MGRNYPTILQWNCRSLTSNGTDLKTRLTEQLSYAKRPIAILLQETRTANFHIPGYISHFLPTITHTATEKPAGQNGMFIRSDQVYTLIDTRKYCTCMQEIIAARIQLATGSRKFKTYILVSAYYRPETSKSTKGSFEWVGELRTLYPTDHIIIGGDFNAKHTTWNYTTNSPRGNDLQASMEAYGFYLQNNIATHTRIGLHVKQRDTNPDLTWADGPLVHDWHVATDPWGSDHYPIWFGLKRAQLRQGTRRITTTNWEAFRSCSICPTKAHDITSLGNEIQRAYQTSSQCSTVDEDCPCPDRHLLNLWDTYYILVNRYKCNGRRFRDLKRARLKHKEIKRYEKELSFLRWTEYCDSFNKDTSTKKLWHTFRSLNGKKKTGNCIAKIALNIGCSIETIEQEAAYNFFPNASLTPPPPHPRVTVTDEDNEESLFTMAEMETALHQVNKRSAPGKDGITWTMLQNLNEQNKQLLLQLLNDVWKSGSIPASMKHSVIQPIPKQGKPTNHVRNLRPVSLTSTIGKLLERMAANRLTYHFEQMTNHFHPGQTGFRPNMGTRDSLWLLRRLINSARPGPPSGQPHILVAVDLQKAFDTVSHEAILAEIEKHYPGKRMYNYVASFLENRTFEIRTGNDDPKTYYNDRGVPQGSIISPLLFNLVMRKVAIDIHKTSGARLTVYADDITLWTERDDYPTTEEACIDLQAALFALENAIQAAGMHPSPEKSTLLLLGGKEQERQKVHLYLENQEIPLGYTTSTIRA